MQQRKKYLATRIGLSGKQKSLINLAHLNGEGK
jgi:hypothetical protein